MGAHPWGIGTEGERRAGWWGGDVGHLGKGPPAPRGVRKGPRAPGAVGCGGEMSCTLGSTRGTPSISDMGDTGRSTCNHRLWGWGWGGGRGDTPRTRGEPLLDQRHAVPSACQLHLDARQRAALTAELCCHRAGLTGPTQRLPAGREPPAAWGGRRGGAQRWGVPSLSPHGQSGGGCRAGWSLTSLPRCAGDIQQLPQQPLLLQVPGRDTATSPSPTPPHSPAYFGPPHVSIPLYPIPSLSPSYPIPSH